jgi:hypothetical protein
MKRTKNGYTPRQRAYAMNIMSPQNKRSKKEIALSVGYTESVSNSVSAKIEKTEGFSNAMRDLAQETGNVILKIMHELKHKDLSKEDFTTLVNAADKMANAWDKVTKPIQDKGEKELKDNPLRFVLNQKIERQEVSINSNEQKSI